jgi:dolichol-phosphate mannosyltransferase
MKITILIAVYNEEKYIEQLLKRVCVRPEPSEIVVVNDGSRDNTLSILEKMYGLDSRINILSLAQNSGKGFAIREGLSKTTGDVIIIQDADLEYAPEDYPRLLAPFSAPEVEVVYGSRCLRSGNKFSYLSYAFGGRFLTFLTNLLYFSDITDEPTGYKVFRAHVLKGLSLTSRGFEFCPEVTAKVLKKSIKIHEVPISYSPRTFAEGKKICFKDGLIAIWTLLKYRVVE